MHNFKTGYITEQHFLLIEEGQTSCWDHTSDFFWGIWELKATWPRLYNRLNLKAKRCTL